MLHSTDPGFVTVTLATFSNGRACLHIVHLVRTSTHQPVNLKKPAGQFF